MFPVRNCESRFKDQSFATFLTWSKKLAEVVGKPNVLWQIPLGNWQQNNTDKHWQDNKVDYLFNNLEKVADAHIAGLCSTWRPALAGRHHLVTCVVKW